MKICCDEQEIKDKIQDLKIQIKNIQNIHTKLQLRKYMHRLQKQLNMMNYYRKEYENVK